MKRKLIFSLFVMIMTMILSNTLYAQSKNTEESATIIGQVQKENQIRFTFEVERDSALCLPQIKTGECYVSSTKFKKYVYVDISETPHIPDSTAKKAFLSNGENMYNFKSAESLPADFTKVERIYTYSGFPWLKLSSTGVKGYYYFYDPATLSMKKKIQMETESETTFHVYLLWAILLLIFITGVLSFLRDNFENLFEDAEWLAILTSIVYFAITMVANLNEFKMNSVVALYPLFYGVCALGAYRFTRNDISEDGISFKIKAKEYSYSYKSAIYFLFSLSAILSLLFWSVNKFELYLGVLPILIMVLMVIVAIPLVIANRKLIKAKFKKAFNR